MKREDRRSSRRLWTEELGRIGRVVLKEIVRSEKGVMSV